MKTTTIQEIRETLARDDAEGINDYKDKFQIYLEGCPGYNNIDAETCVGYYLNKSYLLDSSLEDSEIPVDIAYVTNETGDVLFIISQYCQELSYRSGVELI